MARIFSVSLVGGRSVEFPGTWSNGRWELFHPMVNQAEPVFTVGASLEVFDLLGNPVNACVVSSRLLEV